MFLKSHKLLKKISVVCQVIALPLLVSCASGMRSTSISDESIRQVSDKKSALEVLGLPNSVEDSSEYIVWIYDEGGRTSANLVPVYVDPALPTTVAMSRIESDSNEGQTILVFDRADKLIRVIERKKMKP